jgi:hypothetical protein
MNLFSVKGNQEMSIDEEEIRQYLEGKKLKEITLPQDSNELDKGSDSPKAKEKIGTNHH